MDESIRRRASLEVLRAEASDERSVLVRARLRAGQDPWEFMEELPSVDELVVLLLRAEALEAAGGGLPDESRNYRVLRQIALAYPELTVAVWRTIHDSNSHRLWGARIRTRDVS